MEENNVQPSPEKQNRKPAVLMLPLIAALSLVFVIGLKWIFSLPSEGIASAPFLIFDYAVGLTMIFLPCTLPLAFVIVPLAMGKAPGKGIAMALAFGAGVAITLGFYGVLIGLLGQALGINQIETAKNILYTLAGIFALSFALGDLGIIRFRQPTLNVPVPQFVLRQRDLLKAGLMGLFLGNVGVGCPNPLFNAVIIPSIVATGSALQGFVIMIVQALGRVTPLLILAFLAILGVNLTGFLVKNREKVEHVTGWVTVFIGGFLIVLGFFGHDWWVLSGQHTAWEIITQEEFITNTLGGKVSQLGHTHGLEGLKKTGLLGVPIAWGTPVLLFLWIAPMFFYWWKKRDRMLFWFFVMFSALLISIFGWILPHQFQAHWSQAHPKEALVPFHVELETPKEMLAGKPFQLLIKVHDEKGRPITDLQISHDSILHLVTLSEDLQEFRHVHPEDSHGDIKAMIEKGEYRIPLTLNTPGRHRVLVSAFRKGTEVSDLAWLTLPGRKPIFIQKDLSRDKEFNGYRVKLLPDPEELKSGEISHLQYQISQNNTPLGEVEKYMGADMHLIVVSADLSSAMHIHGKMEKGIIDAHVVFPYPGLWKIFGQFLHRGKIITTDFMVEVLPGKSQALAPLPHLDEH